MYGAPVPNLTLAKVKVHLKVDDDINDEDDLIEELIRSAVTTCEGRIFRSMDDVKKQYGFIPMPLVSWMKCAITELYQYRSLSKDGRLRNNEYVESLLEPYIDYSKGT